MSVKKNVKYKFSYIFVVVLVIMVLVLAVGFIAKFTNNFTSDFATFFVKHDGKIITSASGGYNLEKGTEYRFDVGYSLGVFNKEKLGYHVTVEPNITTETDFIFENADYRYKFSEKSDLTEQFKIVKYDGYFMLVADKLLPEVVNSAYDGNYSGIPNTDFKHDYFKLVISSTDKSAVINITFNIVVSIEGVNSNYEHIIVG